RNRHPRDHLSDQVLKRLQLPTIPVADILTLTSCDGLVQQTNGIITREVEATHRHRRRIIVTRDDCIAIETDAILVLVHRSSFLSGRLIHSKSNNATQTGPTPAMANVITAVAAFSASRRIFPPRP